MPVSVIVRSAGGEKARLTFDGTQRVVIGRGASSDIRLPDPSVSHRHAILRAEGPDFVIVDERSTNGTYVGDVRVAPGTSRIVKPGDVVRVGRVRLEIRPDRHPATRDLAVATRDLALSIVARAMEAVGEDLAPRVRVVEGKDQGFTLPLAEVDRVYLVGRAPHCDLSLADSDASREHVQILRRHEGIFVRDLGAKNGTSMGEARVPSDRDVAWRPSYMIRVGCSVLALIEPVSQALAQIESAADEPWVEPPGANDVALEPASPEASAIGPSDGLSDSAKASRSAINRLRWSPADLLVMSAALGILLLSLAGLVWLLRS